MKGESFTLPPSNRLLYSIHFKKCVYWGGTVIPLLVCFVPSLHIPTNTHQSEREKEKEGRKGEDCFVRAVTASNFRSWPGPVEMHGDTFGV